MRRLVVCLLLMELTAVSADDNQWSKKKVAESAVLGGFGGVGVAVATKATLSAIGFTATGIAKASFAAAVQSAVYGPTTSGVFATLTSLGMGRTSLMTVGAPAGVAVGIGYLLFG